MSIPRAEYPRPQFVRVNENNEPDWLCLNGTWQFEVDAGDSGLERGLRLSDLSGEITVPFCPESDLSGVGNKDFLNAVWYRRTVEIPQAWAGKRVLLHFQAVDYDATVWVVGKHADAANATETATGIALEPAIEVGRHRGGFTPFVCDLSGLAHAGESVTLVLRARDFNRIAQPRGKQAGSYAPAGCHYTRTTGIWQTVWMEAVPEAAYLKRPRITPDAAAGAFHLELPLSNNRPGAAVRALLLNAEGQEIARASARADLDLSPRLYLPIPDAEKRFWGPADPYLYGLRLELVDADGSVTDGFDSYAGLRSLAIDGKKIKINGETIFQRLVLDQGYYPDGVMTAPSDEALVYDIQLSLDAGFNGARLHQKVFEERFLYHADRMGYLVWGEFADWGVSNYGPTHDHQKPSSTYVAQWLEALERDYSHPAIIGWCGLNETHQQLHDRITDLDDATRAMFLAAKALDTTRPVLDTSGYAHRVRETDVYDSHYYIEEKDFEMGLERFRDFHGHSANYTAYLNPSPTSVTNPNYVPQTWSVPYAGQPYWVSEFGGFKWNPETRAKSATENTKNRKTSWGYGSDPETLDDFYARFEATCHILLDNPAMFGYCYTQLTDVYPEENGIYTFDRQPKFDNARIKAVQERVAGIEKEQPPPAQ